MAIRFRCPECNQLMSIASRMAGKSVECPSCGVDAIVPSEDPASPIEDAATATTADTEDVADDHAADEDLDPVEFDVVGESEAVEESPRESPPPEEQPTRAAAIDQLYDDEEDLEGPLMRSAETELEEMDLTPMVDVTFLLLIFFMITASFSLHKTIEVPTPDPEEQGATQSIQKIEDLLDASIKVEIDDRDMITIDDEPLSDLDALTDTLRDKMRSDQKVELLLRASSGARHGSVVAVVDAGNAVGMQSIRMVVTPAGDTQ